MSVGQRHIFSWLHLSDLHFGHGDAQYKWDQRSVLTAVLDDIENALKNWPELPPINAVILTGDISFSGGSVSHSEYQEAGEFLNKLVELLGIEKSRVYMVPGNHDVQRGINPEVVEQIRKSTGIDKVFSNDEHARNRLIERFSNFQKFESDYQCRDIECWTETIDIDDFGDIAIVGLNSAITCADDADLGQLELTAKQIHCLSTTKASVRLVLTHHPLNEKWIKDETTIQPRMLQHRTVHLYGHVHDPRVETISSAGSSNHIRVVAAAAHRDPKEAKSGKDSHGYNFASLMVDPQGNLVLRSWPRRWFPHWNSFHVDHLGVPDRRFFDDRTLANGFTGSGLNLDSPHQVHLDGVHWWKDHIGWDKLLFNKRTLDVYGISVRTLFEQPNVDHIKTFLNRGGNVRVVLADPRDRHSMAQYEKDFDSIQGDRSKKIIDILSAIDNLRTSLSEPENLSVRISPHYFKYSAYRIDGDVLFVPYRLTPGKTTSDMPGFLFERSGSVVTRFFATDMEGLYDSAIPFEGAVRSEILRTRK
jgi:predicted phosphodiesterase